jgi:hypothetical protein
MKETRTMLRTTLLILTAFGLAVAAAPASARADEPSRSDTGEVAAPCAGPGAHGPLGLVHAALEQPIGLSSEQRSTIETSLASLHEDASRHLVLAAQIRAGAIDESAFHGPTSEERAAHEAAAAAVITTLHDTLTPAQRSALVAAVLAERSGSVKRGGRESRGDGPIRLFEGLGLDAAQESAVRAVLASGHPDEATMRARFEPMRSQHEAKLQSFVGASFDAQAFVAPPADAVHVEERPDRMVHDLTAIVPLLTAAQREALAQRLEAGPPRRVATET